MTAHNQEQDGSSDHLDADVEIERLLDRISILAIEWRYANATLNRECRSEVHEEYLTAMERRYELGWDDNLDMDSELSNR